MRNANAAMVKFAYKLPWVVTLARAGEFESPWPQKNDPIPDGIIFLTLP